VGATCTRFFSNLFPGCQMSLLAGVVSTAQVLPSRVFFYAREKFGKSSLFAHAPGVIYFMTRGETGLVELIGSGRVPPTPHFAYDEAAPPTWDTLRDGIGELIATAHPYKTLVIDTCNGAEILCQEFVRNKFFRGDQAKFASYGKGWDNCRVQWLELLRDLDELRSRKKMSIVFLAHTKVKKFEDPTQQEAWDKYQPACQEKLWDLTHKWADIICFGHFKTTVYENDAGKIKAKEDASKRVICFDQSPTWEAGNRYGITGELDVSNGALNGFKAFAGAVSAARAAGLKAAKGSSLPAATPTETVTEPQEAPPLASPPVTQATSPPEVTAPGASHQASPPVTPPIAPTGGVDVAAGAEPVQPPQSQNVTEDNLFDLSEEQLAELQQEQLKLNDAIQNAHIVYEVAMHRHGYEACGWEKKSNTEKPPGMGTLGIEQLKRLRDCIIAAQVAVHHHNNPTKKKGAA
jgi:hypothetical protein